MQCANISRSSLDLLILPTSGFVTCVPGVLVSDFICKIVHNLLILLDQSDLHQFLGGLCTALFMQEIE